MALATSVKQVFDGKTVVPVLLAIVAFLVSWKAGTWLEKYHPALRYVPGAVLLVGGVGYARREGGKGAGIGVIAGAGLELALTAGERFGVLPKLGFR